MDASLISTLRKPAHGDRVYKDECMFSFATPLTPGGIYLNLATFQVRVLAEPNSRGRLPVGVSAGGDLAPAACPRAILVSQRDGGG